MKVSSEELIYYLIHQKQPVTNKQLATHFAVSEKTIWNRIHSFEMKEILKEKVKIVSTSNVGITLAGTEEELLALKERVNQLFGEKHHSDQLRQNLILIDLLLRDKSYTTKKLMYRYFVSRKVIAQDFQHISDYLNGSELLLEKKPNTGISISGDEIMIRQLLEKTILQISSYYKHDLRKNVVFDEGIKRVLEKVQLDRYLPQAIKIVDEIQRDLLGAFTDEGRKEIIVQLLISHFCSSQLKKQIEIDRELFGMNHHCEQFKQIFQRNYLPLEQNDYLYLWNRCINNRFSTTVDQSIDKSFIQMAKTLLKDTIGLAENEADESLIQNLAFHLTQAAKRSSIKIHINNPVLDQIKQKYGKFYSMVLTKISRIEKEYDMSLNADEIGFITLYICAIYEKQIRNKFYKVLLVSDEGIGQTQLISMQIMNRLPNLLIQYHSNSLHLEEKQLADCDLIISTTPILLKPDYLKKYVRVSNFINERDIEKISKHLLSKSQELLVDNKTTQKEIVFNYFSSNLSSKEAILKEYLHQAVQLGYCQQPFINSVFEREKRASTSIGKGIAIPHGESQWITQPAIFFIKNQEKIFWGKDEVDIVLLLILAFDNQHENGQFLTRLYTCMEKTDLIRKVHNAQTLEEMKKYVLYGELKDD